MIEQDTPRERLLRSLESGVDEMRHIEEDDGLTEVEKNQEFTLLITSMSRLVHAWQWQRFEVLVKASRPGSDKKAC